jgi:NAD(P)H-nitrite reductase large subunit
MTDVGGNNQQAAARCVQDGAEATAAQDLVVVCRCEEVTKTEVAAAIADGATTIKGVKLRTQAGMGLCQGRGCRKLIQGQIAQSGARPAAAILPPNARTPVRTAPISEFINEEDD